MRAFCTTLCVLAGMALPVLGNYVVETVPWVSLWAVVPAVFIGWGGLYTAILMIWNIIKIG